MSYYKYSTSLYIAGQIRPTPTSWVDDRTAAVLAIETLEQSQFLLLRCGAYTYLPLGVTIELS
jgi:hypothetical protein